MSLAQKFVRPVCYLPFALYKGGPGRPAIGSFPPCGRGVVYSSMVIIRIAPAVFFSPKTVAGVLVNLSSVLPNKWTHNSFKSLISLHLGGPGGVNGAERRCWRLGAKLGRKLVIIVRARRW